MRSIVLAKGGVAKLRGHQKELKQTDVEDSLRSLPPGEWCFFTHSSVANCWLGFVNPMVDEKFVSIHIVADLATEEKANFSLEGFLSANIQRAFRKRQIFKGYDLGSRIFYGFADGLPGLIVDQFKDKAIIQINTAGIDRYRQLIQKTVEELIRGKAYLLDNPKYREKEFLPIYENESIPSLEVHENGLTYFIRAEVLQKVGFYYDHRENRQQLISLLTRLDRVFTRGIDLFCYAGAWGLNALKGGVESVDFVDQGDFHSEIDWALEKNEFKGRGAFHRSDVFKFLDQAIQKMHFYDVILCDPPAFAKSHLQKNQALEGYSKLHRKVFKAAAPGALLVFSSCTHYVGHEEFQKNILDAAYKENKRIQLIHSGIQGWDHPINSQQDRANYIKSYFYLME